MLVVALVAAALHPAAGRAQQASIQGMVSSSATAACRSPQISAMAASVSSSRRIVAGNWGMAPRMSELADQGVDAAGALPAIDEHHDELTEGAGHA